MKSPFDKPMSFVKLFDSKRQAQIIKLVNELKENAVEMAGEWFEKVLKAADI
jgi:type I restriction enzyme R subunit